MNEVDETFIHVVTVHTDPFIVKVTEEGKRNQRINVEEDQAENEDPE